MKQHKVSTTRKAVILAAGFGERMRPFSYATPKPMMPFGGEPIINHSLHTLADWGVRDVLVNLHHAPSSILEHLRNIRIPGIRVCLSFEPEIRGTGGALKRAAWFLDSNPFWLINSDVVFSLNPELMIEAFSARQRTMASLWLIPDKGPRTVISENGFVKSFRTDSPGRDGALTFSGIHFVSPELLNYLPDKPFSSIIEAYSSAITAGFRIAGVTDPESYWADAGSPEKLLSTHIELASAASRHLTRLHRLILASAAFTKRRLQSKGARVSGFAWGGEEVQIKGTPLISNSILGRHITLHEKAAATDCIVGDRTSLKNHVRRAAAPLESCFNRDELDALLGAGLTLDSTVEALSPRGSDRAFFRIYCGRVSSILIKYSRKRPENARFAGHLLFLKSIGIPVPELILDLPDKNICIVEDLGGDSVQSSLKKLPDRQILKLYERITGHIATLHEEGTSAAAKRHLSLEPPFDRNLYLWEHQLFVEQFLNRHIHPDKATVNSIIEELAAVPSLLLKHGRSLIHRDLQSSNILLRAGRPVFIDFQGMRTGSRYYDLASLLLDPYAGLPSSLCIKLTESYSSLTGLDQEEALKNLKIAGIQRLTQALGAFGRLSLLEGMEHFRSYIQPASEMLLRCIKDVPGFPVLRGCLENSIRQPE